MRTWIAPVLVLLSLPGMAHEVYLTDQFGSPTRILRADTSTGTISIDTDDRRAGGYDVMVGPDSLIYYGGEAGIARTPPDGSGLGALWAVIDTCYDLAFLPDGDVMAIQDYASPLSASHAARISATGVQEWTWAPSGHEIWGLDVARAGAREGQALVLTVEERTGKHWIWYLTDVAGAPNAEGPFGPLDIPGYPDCFFILPAGCARHPTFDAAGDSFYLLDGANEQVKQFNLDGSLRGAFVTVPPDPVALASSVPGSRGDFLTNVLPLPDGTVLVGTARRLYYFDAAGTLLYRFDHIFGGLMAIGNANWVDFESAGVRCRPWSVGFWKRQCATLGERRRPIGGRGPRGMSPGQPPLHPAMSSIVDLAATIERANRWLEPYGLSACAALQPDAPSEWREKALRRYAAIALNFEHRRLGRRCDVTVDGVQRTVGDVLEEVRALLGSMDEDDLKWAFQLTGDMLGEVSE